MNIKTDKEIRKELKEYKRVNGVMFNNGIELLRIGYKYITYRENGTLKYSYLNHFYYIVLNNQI